MSKTVRHSPLANRTQRARLEIRGEPYWQTLDRNCHLGYRRGRVSGRWVARLYLGPDKGYRQERLGTADDTAPADGAAVLDYFQAMATARALFATVMRPTGLAPPTAIDASYTVEQAFEEYLAWMADHRQAPRTARNAYEAHIKPAFAARPIASLSSPELRAWHSALSKSPPRRRSKGKDRRVRHHDVDMNDPEIQRRRRSTANTLLSVFKAGLNRAWREGKVASDIEWRRVQPFPDSVGVRLRFLTADECRRLINAAPSDLRLLVQAGLLTGARYAEIGRLQAADYNPVRGSVLIRKSKTGKARSIPLSEEGQHFFGALAAGKLPSAPMLLRDDGTIWNKSVQSRPMRETCAAARIEPAASFHILRHTYASHAIMNGAPLIVVAKALGHADTRMIEKHYGHLAPDFIGEAIRAAVPVYGIRIGNVAALAERRS